MIDNLKQHRLSLSALYRNRPVHPDDDDPYRARWNRAGFLRACLQSFED